MNEIEIKKALDIFKADGEVIEIRTINSRGMTASGYFKNKETAVSCIKRFPSSQIYFVINRIKEECYSREQQNAMLEKAKVTTNDSDIEMRDWLFIDVDPTRPSGVSSSEGEKGKAKIVANAVYTYLKRIGFAEPVTADSGNGWHLLYKINLTNTEENKELIKKVLSTLDMLFSDENAKIDVSVFNASRICKLYGTVAQKGSNTESRPHRESKILKVPNEIKNTPKTLLQKVCEDIPEPERPTYKNNYDTKFDIDDFISKHNIRVQKIMMYGSGKKYVLEECVFDSDHKAPDACIFVLNNGAIGYKCFHNSCQRYSWKDVRLKFEPNAYDTRHDYAIAKQQKKVQLTRESLVGLAKAEDTAETKAFLDFDEIGDVDESDALIIKSGYTSLDNKIKGFRKGEVSVWSGANGSGKSTMLMQLCLNAAEQGFKSSICSFELPNYRTRKWMRMQAAGRQNTITVDGGQSFFVPHNTEAKIDSWAKGKIQIYNDLKGNKIGDIIDNVKKLYETTGADVIILDNLMSTDISDLYGFENLEKQKTLLLVLSDFAKKYTPHIHLVAHPRKSVGFLRKNDISGNSDITNIADNVFIAHRVNNDFKLHAKEFWGEATASKYYIYDNVIECCKNRDLGAMDEVFPLYFEKQSKRMLNEQYENVCYGWEDKPKFVEDVQFDYEDGDLPF